jgi:hypothetical protein
MTLFDLLILPSHYRVQSKFEQNHPTVGLNPQKNKNVPGNLKKPVLKQRAILLAYIAYLLPLKYKNFQPNR